MSTATLIFPQYTGSISIANGAQQSSAIDLSNGTLVALILPTTFTGTALTFQMSTTLGGTYIDMIDGAGNTYSKTVAQNKYLPLAAQDFAGIRYLKVTSGSAEGAARTIVPVVRNVN